MIPAPYCSTRGIVLGMESFSAEPGPERMRASDAEQHPCAPIEPGLVEPAPACAARARRVTPGVRGAHPPTGFRGSIPCRGYTAWNNMGRTPRLSQHDYILFHARYSTRHGIFSAELRPERTAPRTPNVAKPCAPLPGTTRRAGSTSPNSVGAPRPPLPRPPSTSCARLFADLPDARARRLPPSGRRAAVGRVFPRPPAVGTRQPAADEAGRSGVGRRCPSRSCCSRCSSRSPWGRCCTAPRPSRSSPWSSSSSTAVVAEGASMTGTFRFGAVAGGGAPGGAGVGCDGPARGRARILHAAVPRHDQHIAPFAALAGRGARRPALCGWARTCSPLPLRSPATVAWETVGPGRAERRPVRTGPRRGPSRLGA